MGAAVDGEIDDAVGAARQISRPLAQRRIGKPDEIADAEGSPTLTVWASNGNVAAVNGGPQRSSMTMVATTRVALGSNPLNYTFSLADNTTRNAGGVGAAYTYPLSGSIGPNQDVAIGNYADSLTATVSF